MIASQPEIFKKNLMRKHKSLPKKEHQKPTTLPESHISKSYSQAWEFKNLE